MPNSFFPIETKPVFSGTEINNREFVFQKETESENIEKLGTDPLPSFTDSNSGGETLQDKDPILKNYPTTELKVYSRRKPYSNREQPHLVQDQLSFSRSDPELDVTQPGNPSVTTLPSTSMPTENPIIPRTFDTDLDIPIVVRKGVRSCTTHSIAQYLSYHRLSSNYKAFTSKISHLFIPRNIQKALGHPN